MESLPSFITSVLDTILYGVIEPVFSLVARLFEVVILTPMQLLDFPPWLQVSMVAILTALLSLFLRKLVKADEKERAFKENFIAKKEQQEDLHLISDWKSREKFAKAMDDDIDQDFNTYLAGRFARYGIAYLLPIFLVLYWLDHSTGYTTIIDLPENSSDIKGIPVMVVFLITYCASLFVYFTLRKRKQKRNQATTID